MEEYNYNRADYYRTEFDFDSGSADSDNVLPLKSERFNFSIYAKEQLRDSFNTGSFRNTYNLYYDELKEDPKEFDYFFMFVAQYYKDNYDLDVTVLCEDKMEYFLKVFRFIELYLPRIMSKIIRIEQNSQSLYKVSINEILTYIKDPIIKDLITKISKEILDDIIISKIRIAIITD